MRRDFQAGHARSSLVTSMQEQSLRTTPRPAVALRDRCPDSGGVVPELAVIAQVRRANRVSGMPVQRTADGVVVTVDLQIVADPEAALVKERVVVRAQAQNIVRPIRPVVWRAECTDVRTLGDRSAGGTKGNSTYLAGVRVQALHGSGYRRTPRDAGGHSDVPIRLFRAFRKTDVDFDRRTFRVT